MRVLLDECIPRKFKRALPNLACLTVAEAGLAGKRNGILLTLAESAGFEVLLTLDSGIEYQQNLAGRNIAVLIVRAKSNRLKDLLPLAQACLASIAAIAPGDVRRIA